MGSTIFDEIGGQPAVTAVVDAFHQRVVADPELTSYFDSRDMARLKAHQRALVSVALGGTGEEYNGRMMHPAHSGLSITNGAFDRVLDHLLAALADVGVPAASSAKILAILRPLRSDVVQSAVVGAR
jgi:hemoglobin